MTAATAWAVACSNCHSGGVAGGAVRAAEASYTGLTLVSLLHLLAHWREQHHDRQPCARS